MFSFCRYQLSIALSDTFNGCKNLLNTNLTKKELEGKGDSRDREV